MYLTCEKASSTEPASHIQSKGTPTRPASVNNQKTTQQQEWATDRCNAEDLKIIHGVEEPGTKDDVIAHV